MGGMANFLVELSLLLILSCFCGGIDVEPETITKFFKKVDTNLDGLLSKKEFYYALMDDEFENLSSKTMVPSMELEFEGQDENGDRRISLQEWERIFFPRTLEESDASTEEIGKLEQVREQFNNLHICSICK